MLEGEMIMAAKEIVNNPAIQLGGLGIGSGAIFWAINNIIDIFIKVD